MVRNESHIDVLFRQGLSGTEVLPPSSVWDNIKPFIRKRNRKVVFFKMAAGLAILTSLSLMAWFLSGNIAGDRNPALTASSDRLSTLFDASYIGVAVDVKNNEISSPDQSMTEGRSVEANYVAPLDDNIVRKDAGRIISQQNLAMGYDRLNSTTLRFTDIPREVMIQSQAESIVATDILPVEPAEEGKVKRWELGAMMSPTYLSSTLNTTNEGLKQINENESPVLSYTGGVSLSYKMTGRLSLQTGLYYSSLGRNVRGVTSFSGFAPFASSKSGKIFGVETSSGTVYTTNRDVYLTDIAGNRIEGYYSVDNFDPLKSDLVPFGTQLRQSFEYLQVPLILSYKLIDRKMDFNILGGMAYSFLIGNQTWALNDEGSKIALGSTEGIEHLLLSSSLGLSMEYELSERFSLNLEPNVRYFLNTGGELGSGNPYTFGIYSGMHFKF